MKHFFKTGERRDSVQFASPLTQQLILPMLEELQLEDQTRLYDSLNFGEN